MVCSGSNLSSLFQSQWNSKINFLPQAVAEFLESILNSPNLGVVCFRKEHKIICKKESFHTDDKQVRREGIPLSNSSRWFKRLRNISIPIDLDCRGGNTIHNSQNNFNREPQLLNAIFNKVPI